MDQYWHLEENSSQFYTENQKRLKGEEIDTVIKIGTQTFFAHRTVLVSEVDFFKNLLDSIPDDSTPKVVTIDEEFINPEVFEDILELVYVGQIQFTPQKSRLLFEAALHMNMDSLKNAAERYFCRLIEGENFYEFFDLAETYKLQVLANKLQDRLPHIVQEVSMTEEFLHQSFERIKLLVESSRRDVAVFNAIIRWVSHDSSTRLEHLPVLLKSISLQSLPKEFLINDIPAIPLISQSPECLKMYFEALSTDIKTECLFNIGGTNSKVLSSVSKWNPRANLWTPLAPMPGPRSNAGAAVIGKKIYVVCGQDGKYFLNSCIVYDIPTNKWTTLAPMKIAKEGCGVAALNGFVYVAGGQYNDSCLNNLDRYDPTTNTWTECSPMVHKRSTFELVAWSERLYAIGGSINRATRIPTVECYNPDINLWEIVSTSEHNGFSGGSAVLNNRIYVCSGKYFKEYNPETDTWRVLDNSLIPCVGRKLISIDGRLLLMGGLENVEGDRETFKTIREIFLETRTRKFSGQMDVARGYHSVAVVQL